MSTRGLAGCTSALALLALVLVAAVGAGAQRSELDTAPHLFSVPTDGRPAAALARTDARVIARYEAFTLVEAAGNDAERLRRAGADLRDDMRELKVGRREIDPALDRAPLRAKSRGRPEPGLAVVQFAGPIKDAWLERLRRTGVRVVTYMAENGYLVSGSAKELVALSALAGSDPAIRAVVGYTAADKLGAGVRQDGRQRLAVQTLSGPVGAPARTRAADLGRELPQTSAVGPYRTQYVELGGAEAAALAEDPGVISILAAPEPELYDERQDQILVGALTGPDPLLPSGPGYLAFHNALPLDDPAIPGVESFPFTVDLTDSGLDTGSTSPGQQDFYEGGAPPNTRVSYADNFTVDPDGRDCGGHGTLNASIVAGFNNASGAAVEDAQGFNYGLGVAPRARVGSSKIFTCAEGFSLSGSVTSLTSSSYTKSARIANHSWGANVGGAYNTLAQEFDALVRDAQPSTPGNQEMVEVVSAGNAGPTANTTGSPGTAKNVITVGASESPRASGTDGCDVTNIQSDDARDMAFFSSRGPTDDARVKPDILGPGTHIIGAQSQASGYDGNGVCDATFPTGSTLYNLSSGTSHSAPAVAAMAALFRQWYRLNKGNGTATPSPALTKAALAGSGTDLVGGDGVLGSVPAGSQGWGLANIPRLLDPGPRFFWDQQTTFGATGEAFDRTFAVQDPSKPVRVTVAWTDPPGPTSGNSFVNNLDLVVGAGSGVYKGNVFSGGVSTPGGVADPRNNLESVYLPAGPSGNFSVSVVAANIAGNGVPGVGDATDQDFALVVSNAAVVTAPVLSPQSSTVTPFGDGDPALEPGERFGVSGEVKNTGSAPATGIGGTLSGPASVRLTDPVAGWPNLDPGATATNSDPISATLRASASCGAPVQLTLAIAGGQGSVATIPITVETGAPGAAVQRDNEDGSKPIPDNNSTGVTSVVNVADPGAVKDVDVRIPSLTHTFDGDLKIELTSPSGTTVVLANRPGGTTNSGDNFTNTVFDDEAATALGSGSPPYTGSFRPQADQLSRFDGEPQAGNWILKVADLASLDNGILHSWGHDISVGVCDFVPPPAPGQPAGLVATPGADSVSLDWSDVPSATGYEVFRRLPDGSYSEVPTALPTSSEFLDSGRTPGQQYCYVVGATTGGTPGPTSAEACATIPGGVGPGGGGPTGNGPPTLDLSSLKRSIRVGRNRTFVITFVGQSGHAGSVALTTVRAVAAQRRKRKLVVARKSFTVPASGRVRLKMKLTRKGFRVLRRARRLRVSAKVTLDPTSATKRVTLRAPRPRPRR